MHAMSEQPPDPDKKNGRPSQPSRWPHVPMCFREPEIPEVPDADKPVVRNVLYTAWALQENTGSPCIGWQVFSIFSPPHFHLSFVGDVKKKR